MISRCFHPYLKFGIFSSAMSLIKFEFFYHTCFNLYCYKDFEEAAKDIGGKCEERKGRKEERKKV